MRLRTLHDLKLAFSEFYLGLILLQNYQTLNFTGFRKILKKHDKVGRNYFVKGLCQVKTFKKSELTREVGGWVQVSLGIFLVGK